MALTSTDQAPEGAQVTVEPFRGTVLESPSSGSTVKIMDDNGAVHYISANRVTLVPKIPYMDGRVYISAGGSVLAYKAGKDEYTPGTWLAYDLTENQPTDREEKFSYPGLPLRMITFGEPLRYG